MNKQKHKTVVRLQTSYWASKRGIHSKKEIIFLKRKSYGFNQIEEDAKCSEADLAINAIVNFNDVKDGVYELKMINIDHDFETGYCDNWEYELVKSNE